MGCGTLIALGLAGAGAGLSYSAAQDEQSGMNNAIQNNLAGLQKFEQKGQGLFNQGLSNSTPQIANKTISAGQQQFTNAANNAQQTGFGFATPLDTKNTSASDARGKLGASAMGNFAGYQTLPQSWQNQNATLWPQMGINNSSAQQWNAMLPSALQNASRSQQGRSSLGSLVSGLGSLVSGLNSMGGSGGSGGSSVDMSQANQFASPAQPISNYGLWAPYANAGF